MKKHIFYWAIFNALIWIAAIFLWNKNLELNIDIWYFIIGYANIIIGLSVLSIVALVVSILWTRKKGAYFPQ